METKTITTSRLTTACRVHGTPGARKLLLIHGNASSSAFYEPLMERLEGELANLKLRCAQLEESVFESMAKEQAGKGNVLLFQPAMRPDSVRRLMDAVSKTCGGLAAVFAGEDGHYAYALGRADGQDISPLVKAMNTVLHGRGGGRNGFAQGSVEVERSAIESFFKENGYGICD